MLPPPEIVFCGRLPYAEALHLQDTTVDAIVAGTGRETLFLLEHDPVYTMGRSSDSSSIGDAHTLPHPVEWIGRGGKATYHGPGQLVGYPILDLRTRGKDLHRYLRFLEDTLIGLLAEFGITAGQREELTGVWIGPRKIASIGVGVRHWITMHGFALNVCCDLSPFTQITPCGIHGVEMTSMNIETGRDFSVDEVARRAAEIFTRALAEPFVPESLQTSAPPAQAP